MKPSLWALRHPVPVAVITAAAVVFGCIALITLNREFVPPITKQTIRILTLWPAVAAEDVEREVSSVLEDRYATISGLQDMKSESREGVSIVALQFADNRDLDLLVQEVRARTDQAIAELPVGIVGRPEVSSSGSLDLPVFTFSVASPMNPDTLFRLVDDIVVPELFEIDGVARAGILGDRPSILEVRLDLKALAGAGATPLDVYEALQGRNTAVPAGLVESQGRDWAFRVSGEFTEISDIENLVIAYPANIPLRLADVAEVAEVEAEGDERIRSAGRDLLVVQVTKRESGNSLRISREIQTRLDTLGQIHGIDVTVLHDDADTVFRALSTVGQSALAGLFMAVAVIWLFLRNWRFTLVIAVSLPVSLVMAFAGMRLAGQSINILSMAGITVSLGMVVDASIVVLENIHRRVSRGESPEPAVENGSIGISQAVVASVATSVCVFAPMIFLKGIVGNVLRDLSLTLVFTLGASLFAALFVVPPLLRRSLNRDRYRKKLPKNRTFMGGLETRYRRSLQSSFSMSGAVVFAAVSLLVISVFAVDFMGASFIPAADYNEVFVSIDLPPGSTVDKGISVADRVEDILLEELEDVEKTIFYVGMEDDLQGDARTREALWAQILLKQNSRRDFRVTIRRINEILDPAFPNVSFKVLNGGFDRLVALGTNGYGYRIELSSESWEGLQTASESVLKILQRDPEILSAEKDIRKDRHFVVARIHPDLARGFGVNAENAGFAAKITFDGVDAGDYRPTTGPDRKIRLTSEFTGTVPDSYSGNLLLLPGARTLVPFDVISTIVEEDGLSAIRRHDRKRTITVIGYPENENIRNIGRRMKKALEENPLPAGVTWQVEGVGALIGESAAKLGIVLLVALFLVYAVMAIQFEKLAQPLVIMASVPFCLIGVVGGLAIFGSDISLISFLGLIALGGIVVNNGIVQVDKINRLRRDGLSLDDAVLHGAGSRLRPILMTTLTTFIGVLPLSLAKGSGARIYAPLGQAIAGGLLTSTLVTMYIVPLLYRWVESRKESRSAAKKEDNAVDGAA